MIPKIMGILNCTPDSFSDGGRYLAADLAVRHGVQLRQDGADWVDVGGQSTRPGATPVSVEEELERVMPVVSALTKEGVPVSIDTFQPEVARQALDVGANFLNDVTGFRNMEMRRLAQEYKPDICIMHMRGEPLTMQMNPHYDDVVHEVWSELEATAKEMEKIGLKPKQIYLDPGIGFGKSTEHNLQLLRQLGPHHWPVLIGVSRKSFLGRILGTEDEPAPIEERGWATLATEIFTAERGVAMIRTHAVRPLSDAFKVLRRLSSN